MTTTPCWWCPFRACLACQWQGSSRQTMISDFLDDDKEQNE